MRSYYHQEHEQYGPQIRFGFGGRWTPAVKKIIILTGACFVLQLLLRERPGGIWLLESFALRCEAVLRGQIWQLVTYALLHYGGLWHIFWNMFGLWMFGPEVEKTLGTERFVALYVLSGAIAGICSCVFTPNSLVTGASGCVLGVLMAFGVLFPRRVITLLLFFIVPIRMKARTLVIGYTIIVLLYCSGSLPGEPGIAHFAHLGGLVFGYLFVKTRPWWELFLRGLQRPRAEEPEEGVTAEDEVEMDRLLEKIKSQGLHTLSWREKRFLDRISQRLRNR